MQCILSHFQFQLRDSASSGERQGSITQDELNTVTTINLQSAALHAVPRAPRTSVQQTAADLSSKNQVSSAVESEDISSETTADHGRKSNTKRNRFLLKRQDCLEKGCSESELDLTITSSTTVKSSPSSPLMLSSPPTAHQNNPQAMETAAAAV